MAPVESDLSETFKVMERRLLRGIMTPAMLATWVFGLLLARTKTVVCVKFSKLVMVRVRWFIQVIIRISGNFWTRVSPISGSGSRPQLWSGRSRSPADRAERTDQGVIGGEPVPRRLAGIHDVRQAGKYRVGEPVAAQIVPNPLHGIELRAVGRQR